MAEAVRTRSKPAKAAAQTARAVPLADKAEEGVLNDHGPSDEDFETAPRPAAADAPSSGQGASGQGEVIEPGRSLALADFQPPAIGPGERLIRLAYRLGGSAQF